MMVAFASSRWAVLCGGVVLLMAACRQAPPPAPEAPPPPFKAVGTVQQVMEGIVVPGSQVVFDAAVWSNGVLQGAPSTEEDWHRVEDGALTVAEAANLLMMSPRAKDNEQWMKNATALNAAGTVAFQAAESRDINRVFDAGSQVYAACTNCHRQYAPQAPQ
jgi:hypothetical protein